MIKWLVDQLVAANILAMEDCEGVKFEHLLELLRSHSRTNDSQVRTALVYCVAGVALQQKGWLFGYSLDALVITEMCRFLESYCNILPRKDAEEILHHMLSACWKSALSIFRAILLSSDNLPERVRELFKVELFAALNPPFNIQLAFRNLLGSHHSAKQLSTRTFQRFVSASDLVDETKLLLGRAALLTLQVEDFLDVVLADDPDKQAEHTLRIHYALGNLFAYAHDYKDGLSTFSEYLCNEIDFVGLFCGLAPISGEAFTFSSFTKARGDDHLILGSKLAQLITMELRLLGITAIDLPERAIAMLLGTNIELIITIYGLQRMNDWPQAFATLEKEMSEVGLYSARNVLLSLHCQENPFATLSNALSYYVPRTVLRQGGPRDLDSVRHELNKRKPEDGSLFFILKALECLYEYVELNSKRSLQDVFPLDSAIIPIQQMTKDPWQLLLKACCEARAKGFREDCFQRFKGTLFQGACIRGSTASLLNPFVDRQGLKRMLERAMDILIHRKRMFLAPYIAIIQSSGYGKSKLMFEMSTSCPVFFICLRDSTDQHGIPKRAPIVAELLEGLVSAREAVAILCATMLASVRLKDRVPQPGVGDEPLGRRFAISFVKHGDECHNFQIDFWNEVRSIAYHLLRMGLVLEVSLLLFRWLLIDVLAKGDCWWRSGRRQFRQ